nr:hypothetical protein [Rhodoferax sp.]
MLFETERHQALCTTGWDAMQAQQAILSIVRDVEQARLPQGHWPVHMLDLDGGDAPPATGYQSIYLGSAGTVWALWYLQREGAAHCDVETLGAIELAAQTYPSSPDTGAVVPSYFFGEVGIQLVRWRLTGSGDAADRLYASIQHNIPNPTNEALWAAPGTMVAAWHLGEQTGEERWRTLFAENMEQLGQTWLPIPDKGLYLWTQDL